MIPVRIPADTTVHTVTRGRVLADGHPLADAPCPICDEPLGGLPYALVYVGTHPSDREGGYWTGAAVAVHDLCAGSPTTDEETK